MTLKKNSKNLLKNTIRKIRNNKYKLRQLYEKLEYYEVKMVGYNSPSFEPRYSSRNPSHLSNLDYWLEKVWIVENQINKIEKEIREFYKFIDSLSTLEKNIVERLLDYMRVSDIINLYKINRNMYYFKIKSIEKKLKTYQDFIKST